jgi:1-acyl-sn-glycerol-3-phosphate acyltransferase
MAYFCGYLAAFLGLLLVAVQGTLTLILAIPYRLLIDWWAHRLWKNPLRYSIKLAAWIITEILIKRLLKVTIELHGVKPIIPEGEIVIVIGNHPTSMALAPFYWFVTTYVRSMITTVAKAEHLMNPALGMPVWFIDAGIFINRGNRQRARRTISRAIRKGKLANNCIVIFPDTRRPTPERIQADFDKFKGTIPDLQQWLNHTRVPRSGGLFQLLQSLNQRVTVVNITTSFSRIDYGLKDVARQYQGLLNLNCEVISIPHTITEAELRKHLNMLWRVKNRSIDFWQWETYSNLPN